MFASINKAYAQAIQSLKIDVIDFPENVKISEYKDSEPVTFTCEVSVLPLVTLEKYKGLEVKKESTLVTDDSKTAAIQNTLSQYAKFVTKETFVIQNGDLVKLKLSATINGVAYGKWTLDETSIMCGDSPYTADFDTHLNGLKKEDSQTFDIAYDQAFGNPDVAGNTVSFEVTIVEILRKELPELTDEFCQETLNVENAQTFKDQLFTKLLSEKEAHVKEKFEQDLLEELIQNISVNIAPILIQRETEESIKHFKDNLKKYNLDLESYLKFTQSSNDVFMQTQEELALKRIRTDLALSTVAQQESIVVETSELIDAIKKLNIKGLEKEEDIRENLSTLDTARLEESIKKDKTVQFLIDHCKIVPV